jgi:endonuclease-3
MTNKERVRDKILEYYEQVLRKREQKFCPGNEEADRLVKKDSAAFVFAVIMDQGAQAEKMFEIPYHLKKIMGHLDINMIATMKAEDLYSVFEELPQKPRYWRTAARRIINAARRINDRYGGQAEHIWNNNPKAGDLQSRLDTFDGIGQKKASMATRILGMDLNVPIRNWEEMDVSVDEMIMRVFPRTGLSASNNSQEIIEAARQLNPFFPGALDYPCWMIGRTWCLPQNPNCRTCYISEVYHKIGIK